MASDPPVTGMEQEAKCSICMDYLTDPVSVDCGHNFCQDCITDYFEKWEEIEQRIKCPLCKAQIKKENLRPNWQLASIVEQLRHLLCVKHKKELNLFCIEDGELVCVACERSSEHRTHVLLMLEEAAQEYKAKLLAQLQTLEKKRESLLDQKLVEEQRNQKCVAQLGEEKQKVKSAFEQMEKFLEEKKSSCLAQLGDLQKEIEEKQEKNIARLSEDISSLSDLIAEMERKCHQPANEFLQDIRSALTRSQNGQVGQVQEYSSGLEDRLRSCSFKHSSLKKILEKCEESVVQMLKTESLEQSLNKESLERPVKKVNVTLDPVTAYPFLVLSQDLKSARRGNVCQELPNNPERFDSMPYVLGHERFTSGRHCWEVEVGDEFPRARSAVGVVRESVHRKGNTSLNPKEGIWAVGKVSSFGLKVVAFTFPKPTRLTLKQTPSKFRISLDYEEGRVEFFDAHTDVLIYSFQSASISGETIRPFFQVSSWIRLTV